MDPTFPSPTPCRGCGTPIHQTRMLCPDCTTPVVAGAGPDPRAVPCVVWIPTVLDRVGSEVRVCERRPNGAIILGVFVPATATQPGRSVMFELDSVAASKLVAAMRGQTIP